jgi:ankyrin repeat protein
MLFSSFFLHSGDREMVELLLAKGASVDLVSVSGTPLHISAFKGRDEAMKVLLENNADVGLVTHYFLLKCNFD